MTERAQALEAAMRKIRAHTSYNPAAGRAFLAELLASVERIADAALLAVQPPPPVGSPTTEDIPQLVQRFDLVSVSFAYTSDHEMERADDGEWVRFDDVFPPASLSTVEPTSTCEEGIAVRWCPRCGTCTCHDQSRSPHEWRDDPACPIHGERSAHAPRGADTNE